MESDRNASRNFKLNVSVVKQAYLYLKSYVYHENLNFFLKQKTAEFECDSFDEHIQKLFRSLGGKDFPRSSSFKKWLNSINCRTLPKSVSNPEDKNSNGRKSGLFISNVTTSSEYRVNKLNYFIIAPIELHIIEILWCLIVGPLIEEDLKECCYGNRLDDSAKIFTGGKNTKNSRTLFKHYVGQYSSWRDQALDAAMEISEKGEDVALLSFDFKSYFYNVDLEFEKIVNRIEKGFGDNDQLYGIALMLTDSLEKIFSAYSEKIIPFLSSTHPECKDKTYLPIGFASSAILANWYLAEFDREILETARPDYYGRYVDDIIMVFKNPGTDKEIETSIGSFVGRLLGEQLTEGKEKDSPPYFYIEVDGNRLPVQQDKLMLHFFDREHSQAGLKVFRQELQERSSAFRFLPGEDVDRELDRFAYDILYEGSHNKLRSITGVVENETELAAYLAKHIILRRLCKEDRKDSVLPQLERFFKGETALRFSRLWEKVYQYATVVKDHEFIRMFYESLNSEIDKIKVLPASEESGVNLSGKLQEDLKRYNKISLALCVALLPLDSFKSEPKESNSGRKSKEGLSYLVRNEGIGNLVECLRDANLIRHHLVAWPMANFTNFRGDLTDEQEFRNSDMEDLGLEHRKIDLSPRFIHFDEWQLFYLQKSLVEKRESPLLRWQLIFQKEYDEYFFNIPVKRSEDGKTSEDMQALRNKKIAERLNKRFSKSGDKEKYKKDFDEVRKLTFSVGKKTECSLKARIALANIKIKKSDIEKAIRKDKKPNTSFERQKDLYEILNCAVREKVDMLIMPELSIPVSWLPFMVAHSRRHQQAIIFGLEHWEVKGFVYNVVGGITAF